VELEAVTVLAGGIGQSGLKKNLCPPDDKNRAENQLAAASTGGSGRAVSLGLLARLASAADSREHSNRGRRGSLGGESALTISSKFAYQSVHHLETDFFVRLLASAKSQLNSHLHVIAQELDGMVAFS